MTLQQDVSAATRAEHIAALPLTVRQSVYRAALGSSTSSSLRGTDRLDERVFLALAERGRDPSNAIVRSSIADIVRQSSMAQTSKGLLSAGVWRSLLYSGAKLLKRINATR